MVLKSEIEIRDCSVIERFVERRASQRLMLRSLRMPEILEIRNLSSGERILGSGRSFLELEQFLSLFSSSFSCIFFASKSGGKLMKK